MIYFSETLVALRHDTMRLYLFPILNTKEKIVYAYRLACHKQVYRNLGYDVEKDVSRIKKAYSYKSDVIISM